MGEQTTSAGRLDVRKTYKLYIGGAFPARSRVVRTRCERATGRGSSPTPPSPRARTRDAVRAARSAWPGWSSATAYNRGQVLYRVAELMEGRREQFVSEVSAGEGRSAVAASQTVDAAIDRWVWYAGWADKIAQVVGSSNPVAGPYFDFSVPEPTGVVALIAPQQSSLLGLVSVLAPAIATGNTAVVLASESQPLPSITLSEVLATSDVPGGVVNVLTGRVAEVAPWLASHQDVNAIDLTGATADLHVALEVAAADNLKRVVRAGDTEPDWTTEPGISRLTAYLETKTVWHPLGV